MPIDTATDEGEDQSIVVHDRANFLIDRTTNTVFVSLEADEVFKVIEDLARAMEGGGPVYLVIESDKLYPKEAE